MRRQHSDQFPGIDQGSGLHRAHVRSQQHASRVSCKERIGSNILNDNAGYTFQGRSAPRCVRFSHGSEVIQELALKTMLGSDSEDESQRGRQLMTFPVESICFIFCTLRTRVSSFLASE